MSKQIANDTFIADIKSLLSDARNSVYQVINTTMTETYWEIGKRIVEEEQDGEARAEYGKRLIKNLSDELGKAFGKGFSVDNLENMRRFYLAYSNSETPSRVLEKSETLSHQFKLSWSHYIF